MKLIIWNKANSCSPATYAQRRTIRVNRHGYIYLSGALTAEMELRDGCRLNLANDEQNPKDWYLCRTQHEEGFRLRGDRPGKNAATKRLTGGVEFSNVCLASKLLALAKAECFSVRYLVAKEPVVVDGVKYYKILTANPIPGMPRNAAMPPVTTMTTHTMSQNRQPNQANSLPPSLQPQPSLPMNHAANTPNRPPKRPTQK